MVRIKITNVIQDKEVKSIERTVQCPFCSTFLKNVPKYINQMECWYCYKEFKIQKDPGLWTFDSEDAKYYRTLSIDSQKEQCT